MGSRRGRRQHPMYREEAVGGGAIPGAHAASHASGGSDALSLIDHGSQLTGLGDDDHTQYHTDGRALTWLGTRSTTDLPEGTNLYYTAERVDDRVHALLQDVAGKLTWTYDDGANTLTPVITYDSQYFSGTDWTDLTDAGTTALHTHTLNSLANPDGNKTFNMTTRQLEFLWTNPSGNPLELTASGAYSGALLHIHQHTGNPGSTYLVELESSDTDVEHIKSTLPASDGHVLCAYVDGDTEERFEIHASGEMEWGPGGVTAPDTNLYRSAANVLKTDDAFECGALTINAGGINQALTINSNDAYVQLFMSDNTTGAGADGEVIRRLGDVTSFWANSVSHISLDGAGAVTMSGTLGVTGLTALGNVTVANIYRSVANSYVIVAGGSDNISGGNVTFYGESHAQAYDIEFRADTTLKLAYDHSDGRWEFKIPAVMDSTLGVTGVLTTRGHQPEADETYSSGTPSFRWNTVYSKFLNIESTATLQGGSWSGTFSGSRLKLTNTTDAHGGTEDSGVLHVGPSSANHLCMDQNEIMAKTNGTTVGALFLQADGGSVNIGNASDASLIVNTDDLSVTSGAVSMSGTLGVTGLTTLTNLTVVNQIRRGNSSDRLYISGGLSYILGGNIFLFGESHATQAGDIEFASSNVSKLLYDHSDGQWEFKIPAVMDSTLGVTGISTLTGGAVVGNATGGDDFQLLRFAMSRAWRFEQAGADGAPNQLMLRQEDNGKNFYIGDSAGTVCFTFTPHTTPASGMFRSYMPVDFDLTLNVDGAVTFGSTLGVTGVLTTTSINMTDTTCVLTQGTTDSLKIQSATGYGEFGSRNDAWFHIDTDRAQFYFYKGMTVLGGITPAADITYDLGRHDLAMDYVRSRHFVRGSTTDAFTCFGGGLDSASGPNIIMYGSTHATLAYDMTFRTNATDRMKYDYSDNQWVFNSNIYSAGTLRSIDVITQGSGSRNIVLGSPSGGHIRSKGVAGGWQHIYGWYGDADTDLGGFGCKGTADTLDHFFVGVYSSELTKWTNSLMTVTTAVQMDSTLLLANTLTITGTSGVDLALNLKSGGAIGDDAYLVCNGRGKVGYDGTLVGMVLTTPAASAKHAYFGAEEVWYIRANYGTGVLDVQTVLNISHAGDEMLRLVDSASTGSPWMGFYQTTTLRAFIRSHDTDNALRIGAQYGPVELWSGISGTEEMKFEVDNTADSPDRGYARALNAAVYSVQYSHGTPGAAFTCYGRAGNKHHAILSADRTVTVDLEEDGQRIAATGNFAVTVTAEDISGGEYTLYIYASGGARTITFTGVDAWGGNGAHVGAITSGSTLIVTLVNVAGTIIGYADEVAIAV